MYNRHTKSCSKCGREISLSNIGKHENACTGSISKGIDQWKTESGYQCPYCKRIFSKKGIATHVWRMHEEGKDHKPTLNNTAWNNGLTKDENESVLKMSRTLKKKYATGELKPHFKDKKHTDETKQKISEKLSRNNKGGRCKWFEFEKSSSEHVKLQGTWEVRFACVLEMIDPEWIKPTTSNHSFKWTDDNGIEHTYTPDFYSPKLDKYFEVKGYWWGNDKRKMELVIEQNEANIEMVFKKDLEKYESLVT